MSQLDSQQWAQIRQLFRQAGALPAEARANFLERACADEAVRRETLSLLEYRGTDLQTSAAAIADLASELACEINPDNQVIGANLGPYRVDAIAGYSGMGAVYRASGKTRAICPAGCPTWRRK